MALLKLYKTLQGVVRSHYQKLLILHCMASQSIDFVTQLSQTCYIL